MLKLKLQSFGHLMWRTHSLEKTLMLGKDLDAGGEGDDRGWDGLMASPIQWTWVWVNSGSWWWTGRPGMLQSMGLQSRTRLSDWTEYGFSAHETNDCTLPPLLWQRGQDKHRHDHTLSWVLPKCFVIMCFRKGTWLIKEAFVEAEDCTSLLCCLFVMKHVELHRYIWVEVTCS